MKKVFKPGLAVLGLAGLLLGGSLQAAGTDSEPVQLPRQSDLAAGKAAIEAKDWKKAIDNLNRAAATEPRNADIQNYLGYANRKSGSLDAAFRHYTEGLRLDPRHRGAHEYIGVAYLKAKQPAKAQEHLAKLETICGKNCEEYKDLAKEIAAYTP